MNSLIDFISIIILAYGIGILDKRMKKRKIIVSILAVIGMLCIPKNIHECSIFILYLCVCVILEGNILQKLIWGIELSMVFIIMDYLVVDMEIFIKTIRGMDWNINTLGNYVVPVRILALLIVLLATKRKRTVIGEIVRNSSVRENCYIFISLLVNLFFVAFTQTSMIIGELKYAVPILAVSAVLCGGLQMILCVMLQILSYSKQCLKITNDMNQSYMVLQKEYYQEIDQKNNDLRSFRHDYYSHLYIMEDMMQKHKYEQLKQYLYKLGVQKETSYYIETGNVIANAVINKMYQTCREKKISFKCEGILGEKIGTLDETEICSLFSNALKNALEAVENSNERERKILVKMEAKSEYTKIIIKNTADDIKERNGKLISKKKDKKNHGIGMNNMERILEKNNGVMQWFFVNQEFELRIFIKNDRSQ